MRRMVQRALELRGGSVLPSPRKDTVYSAVTKPFTPGGLVAMVGAAFAGAL